MPDLPAYAVRESTRARNVRLTVSAREGLVVVIPRRFPRSRIPSIVAQRRVWIDRALERVRERREALVASARELPASIELAGIGESWAVEYAATGTAVRTTLAGAVVRVFGPLEPVEDVHAALRRFARRRAQLALPATLATLSVEQDLPFTGVRLRAQRTRWGSCSARGSISLNWTLAFLPPELVRHVMLHELVHTLQLDHSPRFRRLLAEREPDSPVLAGRLRGAWRHVPGWAGVG